MSGKPDCPTCAGEGEIDSGGVTPWDAPIMLPCPTCAPIQFDVKKHNDQLDQLIAAEERPMGINEEGE